MAALADKPRPRINRSRAVETLPCRFSDSERADMTREMILANQERESRENALEDLKDEKKRLEGLIKEADKTISATLKSLDRGFEDRSVEVEKVICYDDGLVTYFRLDTGEEIRTRPLEPERAADAAGGTEGGVMGLDFSHCDAHWSYSGFMSFRQRVANACGLPGNLFQHYDDGTFNQLKDHAVFPFIDHSDCDGELSVDEMQSVIPVLRDVVKQWSDDDYDKIQCLRLIDGMEKAVAAGEPLEFC